jgi:threonine dehydrogenase-like Zn-dependent dehydrogenase
MKAVVIEAPGQVAVCKLDDPTPGYGDVVVQVGACGICGTDLHLVAGESPLARYPLVPGHEFAGDIVAVGPGVAELQVGARVAVDPSLYCGTCETCRLGRANLCERYNALGVTRPGGAAEFAVVPAANVRELPARFDLSLAALIEPVSCAVHGLDMIKAKLGEAVSKVWRR